MRFRGSTRAEVRQHKMTLCLLCCAVSVVSVLTKCLPQHHCCRVSDARMTALMWNKEDTCNSLGFIFHMKFKGCLTGTVRIKIQGKSIGINLTRTRPFGAALKFIARVAIFHQQSEAWQVRYSIPTSLFPFCRANVAAAVGWLQSQLFPS